MSSIDHYNQVARRPPVQCGALRRAHNRCKAKAIAGCLSLTGTALCNCRVLDLACGRGGDINKLAGCRLYTGVDNAEMAVAELKRRAQEIGMAVTVHVADATMVPTTPCEIALCHFALHYFCDTEVHCRSLFAKVGQCLVPGGVFSATYERVPGKDHDMTWGVPHHAVVGDCVDALEWRVPWGLVQGLAMQNGLAVVYNAPLQCMETDAAAGIWLFIVQKTQQ